MNLKMNLKMMSLNGMNLNLKTSSSYLNLNGNLKTSSNGNLSYSNLNGNLKMNLNGMNYSNWSYLMMNLMGW